VFQCSSASRKFLNVNAASQRGQRYSFQCSSASRKFLNSASRCGCSAFGLSFSALQRAENSSIQAGGNVGHDCQRSVSVLFSEPKIPQSRPSSRSPTSDPCFSALQRAENSSISRDWWRRFWHWCFSALQRAENSSIGWWDHTLANVYKFQCSSASRKFLNRRGFYRASV